MHVTTTGTVQLEDCEREICKLYAALVRKNNPGVSFTWRDALRRAVNYGLNNLAGTIHTAAEASR